MKILTLAMLILLSASQCVAQEKKMYLNFFTGVAAFKTDIMQIEGTDFQSSELYTIAPTGLGLSFEFIKNTYIDIHFGIHSLHNDYLKVVGENYGSRLSSQPASARNFGIKLKYEVELPKSFKVIPFVGYSISFINQPAGSVSPFEMRSKSSSTASVNGVVTDVQRDSLFSSTEFIRNTFSGLSVGGELVYDFKNNLGIYFSYAFFYSSKYYAVQYGEYRSTANTTQIANTSFGKSGHFYQLGLRYKVFNY
ncbi:MAG: hypothetical protein ACI8ZM_005421 [Crocinitomix sp.]|jgi:hypothetical protein